VDIFCVSTPVRFSFLNQSVIANELRLEEFSRRSKELLAILVSEKLTPRTKEHRTFWQAHASASMERNVTSRFCLRCANCMFDLYRGNGYAVTAALMLAK